MGGIDGRGCDAVVDEVPSTPSPLDAEQRARRKLILEGAVDAEACVMSVGCLVLGPEL